MRPIALLTDFGLTDPYVGQLRAALARLAPQSTLLDISHQVEPFGTAQAAFFLAASAPHYPVDTVFLCVVDPGVGTARRLLGARLAGQGPGHGPRQQFIAPDSGLLGLLLETPGQPGAELFDLTPAATRYATSATFQGRDIFAPLAARLADDEPLDTMGAPLAHADILSRPWTAPEQVEGGLLAHVLHVDRFGNCVLSVRDKHHFSAPVTGLSQGPHEHTRLRQVRAYGELSPGEVGLLVGSQGFYELAANMASAAGQLTLRPGDPVRLTSGGTV